MGLTKAESEKVLNLSKYSVPERNFLIGALSLYIKDELGPEFKAKGYTYDWKKTFPLKDKKKVPLQYQSLEGYEHKFRKGKTIGTKVEMIYEEALVNQAKIKINDESLMKVILMVGFGILFAVLAYIATFIFYEYWILALVLLLTFICCCLAVIMAVLPGIIGGAIGAALGYGLNMIFTPKESKKTNIQDGQYLAKQIFNYANDLMFRYPPGTAPQDRPVRKGPPMGRPPASGDDRPVRQGAPAGRSVRKGAPPSGRPVREGKKPPKGKAKKGKAKDDDFWDDEF